MFGKLSSAGNISIIFGGLKLRKESGKSSKCGVSLEGAAEMEENENIEAGGNMADVSVHTGTSATVPPVSTSDVPSWSRRSNHATKSSRNGISLAGNAR